MARTTKQLSGGGKDKFLRGVIAAEPSIDEAAAKRLGDAFCVSITDVRVRKDTWENQRQAPQSDPVPAPKSAQAETHLTRPAATPATFDPFSFSALAVLTKQGKAALASKLADVAHTSDLHALAVAQHLTVDASLIEPEVLRAAILSATEQRLAERRAAAS